MGSFAKLFTFKTSYAYNPESFAYVNCTLLKSLPTGLAAGTIVPEALVNFKKSKIKLNVDGFIHTLNFDVVWGPDDVSRKSANDNDSDFDCDEDEDEDEDEEDEDQEEEDEEEEEEEDGKKKDQN
jgi:hypothetical protein